MSRLAAIDIGTNSTRLLISDELGTSLERRATVTGLGQDVDATGAFGIEPMKRTWSVLASYAAAIEQHAVGRLRAIATSAARRASNRDEFLDRAGEILGLRPDVISGEEEASLAFVGSRAAFPQAPAPFAVIDVGGGSTEVAIGDRTPGFLASYEIGSVRMSERVAPSRPMPPGEVETSRRWARSVFAALENLRPATVVGVAATFTSLAAIHAELERYDPDLIEGRSIGLPDLWRIADELAAMSTDSVADFPGIDPARAYVLPAGAIVAATAVESLGAASVVVTGHDSLDGVVRSMTD